MKRLPLSNHDSFFRMIFRIVLLKGITLPVIVFFLILNACKDNKPENPKDLLVITNVSIIDMQDGNISGDMTVVISADTISQIGNTSTLSFPAEAPVVDGKGMYMIPGLWDMHAHTSSNTITRNILYPSFTANGVTGIRVLRADCFKPCWDLQMDIFESRKIQKDVIQGSQIGPRAILGSDLINGSKPGDPSTVEAPGNKEDGKKLVHLLKDRGVDFIKIYNKLPREAFFGIAEEAKKQGLPIAGHVPVAVKTSEAIDAGQKSIEHCCEGNILEECSKEEERLRAKVVQLIQSGEANNMYKYVLEMVKTYDSVKCQEVFKKFVDNHTYFTPTLMATEMDNTLSDYEWRKDERLKYLPKKEIQFWEENEINTAELLGVQDPLIRQKRFEIVNNMNKAGVNLLAGSDCGVFGVFHGFGIHDELQLLVEAGLSELEALQTATINAVEFAGLSDSLGRVEEGMKADFVLLEANPLENISNTKRIFAVVTNGKHYDRKTLDNMLEKISEEANK